MKKHLLFGLICLLLLLLAACAQPAGQGGGVNLNLPDDIPVLSGAIDLAVNATGRGTLVNYQFDTTDVNVVVDYYKSALVSAGWQDGPSADIVANDSATLVRVNDAGDIITVGIVRDPATGNVDVQVDVTRAGE